ncbi:hypothetical protein M0R45_031372 [Rubus argutus]|uniref:RNase H type-1 domain-containing protein n=1 Tax=Rubus argutus TaxID=59490 RepID=A0AAW1WI43_RUBAR
MLDFRLRGEETNCLWSPSVSVDGGESCLCDKAYGARCLLCLCDERTHTGEWEILVRFGGPRRSISDFQGGISGWGPVTWGLATGLKLAVARNFNHILVESDSAILVKLLHSPNLDLHPLGTLLLNCKFIMESFSSCSFKHVHRERNMVADDLVKRSIDKDLGVCFLPISPNFACTSVLDDANGLTRPRIISTAPAVS